jgi:hypothetical protein
MQSITNFFNQQLNIFIMKKTLLLLILPMLFSAFSINAQTTIWDFGTSKSTINGATAVAAWPLTPTTGTTGTIGADTEAVIDKLGLYSNDPSAPSDIINFGAVTASATTFSDSYMATNRFQMNGGGAGSSTGVLLPTQRYVYFTVDGACTVKVWFKTGSNGTARTVLCTNGSTLLGSGTANSGTNGDLVIFSVNISAVQAAVGKIYIYGDGTSNNLYKIEVTGANVTTPALSTSSFKKELDITVYAKQNKIFLSNLKSSTKVNVYNVLGSLVKSIQADADSSLDINSGVYIVNAKSADGEKSVKVIVQ